MTGQLTLIRLQPDFRALTQASAAQNFLPPGGDCGYALHAALLELFGPELSPRAFLLKEGALMGYVDALAQDITEATQLQFPRPGSLASALMPATLEARSMPMAWRTGQELDVQVRVRPIVRSRSGRGRAKGGKEVDAFVLTQPSNENPGDASGRSIAARETAYADWLGHQMSREGACELVIAQMVAFKRTRLLTRPKVEEKRTSAVSEGPDATMHARLRIKDPDTFVALLKRGIGRHRGFGFGMMLLAPPGRILKT